MQHVKIVYTDGRSVTVGISPKAQVQMERHFKVSLMADNRTMEQFYFMAWRAAHLAGVEPNDFDTFLGLMDEVETVDEDGDGIDPDPTTPPEPQRVDSSS